MKDVGYSLAYLCLEFSKRFFRPSVLVHDLGFLLWGKIIFNVKEFSDFWDGHTLNQGGDLCASKLE